MPRIAESPVDTHDESDEEMIVETKPVSVKIDEDKKNDVNVTKVEDEDMADEDEDDDDVAEDEYVIEKILRHKFEDGQLFFKIKWVGYDKASDQTWEPEDNCDGAPEAIAEYFESIGGRPELKAPGKTPTGKRAPRGSQSSTPATTTKTKAKPKVEEEVKQDTWKPPVGEASWEDEVRCIDTLERKADGLVCYVHWNNGRKTQHAAHVVYKKCPQHMLRFYEGHLVFREEESPI